MHEASSLVKMWVKIVLLALLTSNSLSFKRTRHYISSPYGQWREFNSGYHVQLDNINGRVEVLEKILTKAQLDDGTSLNEKSINRAKKSSDVGDVIVALVDPKLGGHGNETFNVFPMNPATEEIWRSKVIERIHSYLTENENDEIFFACMMFYEKYSVRPSGYAVFATIGVMSNIHLVKGYVTNPMTSSGTAVLSYTYSTGLEKAIRISNAIYSRLEVRGDSRRSWKVRIEKAETTVTFDDLKRGTDVDYINKIHARKMTSEEDDVPGQLISSKLGGKGDDAYNVVPMDSKAIESFKNNVEAPIRAFICNSLYKERSVALTISVLYEDEVAMRPAAFIAMSKGLDSDFKIFIQN